MGLWWWNVDRMATWHADALEVTIVSDDGLLLTGAALRCRNGSAERLRFLADVEVLRAWIANAAPTPP
jgi:hypothetical protein